MSLVIWNLQFVMYNLVPVICDLQLRTAICKCLFQENRKVNTLRPLRRIRVNQRVLVQVLAHLQILWFLLLHKIMLKEVDTAAKTWVCNKRPLLQNFKF